MNHKKTNAVPRRTVLQALLALPAFALFRTAPLDDPDEIVIVDGWILKRSDLS